MKDPYNSLGVPRNASAEEIKRAYKKAAMRAHPDRPGGSEEKIKELNTAYALLSDDGRREQYDRTGESGNDDPRNRALQEVAFLFINATENGVSDVIAWIIAQVRQGISQRTTAIAEFRARIEKLERTMKRIRRKSAGPNLVHQFFQAQILTNKNNIAAKEKELERAALMLEIINDYECLTEEQRRALGADKFYIGGSLASPWQR